MNDQPRRLLLVEMGTAGTLAAGIAEATGCVVDLLESKAVDLGQFGGLTVSDRADAVAVWPKRPYPYALYAPALMRRLRAARPDVVLCLGEPTEFGVAQTVLLTRWLLPAAKVLVWSYENVPRRWTRFPGKLRGWLLRPVLRRLHGALAYSESAARVLREQGLAAERVRIAYPPLDDATFAATGPAMDLRGQPSDFVMLYGGRLVREKGVDLLLDALSGLPARVRLAVAGDGPAGDALRQAAEAAGVAERVRWLGRLSPEQMAAAMRGADLLVLPSRTLPEWQEQFGMVLAQAMACGTPVVGSATGAIPEVIGAAGLTFAEGDVADLRRVLLGLVESPERLAGLAAAALASARERFSTAAYQRGLREALAAVLNEGR